MTTDIATRKSLDLAEKKRLRDCERTIDHGKAAFVAVGQALAEIRDSRLYRETHENFQTYCRERWAFDRTYAHRLIQASEVAAEKARIEAEQRMAREAQERAEAERLRIAEESARKAREEALRPDREKLWAVADAVDNIPLPDVSDMLHGTSEILARVREVLTDAAKRIRAMAMDVR